MLRAPRSWPAMTPGSRCRTWPRSWGSRQRPLSSGWTRSSRGVVAVGSLTATATARLRKAARPDDGHRGADPPGATRAAQTRGARCASEAGRGLPDSSTDTRPAAETHCGRPCSASRTERSPRPPAEGTHMTAAAQLALNGMPRRRPFCPARDCDRRCGAAVEAVPCLCRPCNCAWCRRRTERAQQGLPVRTVVPSTISFIPPSISLQQALFRQRPERITR